MQQLIAIDRSLEWEYAIELQFLFDQEFIFYFDMNFFLNSQWTLSITKIHAFTVIKSAIVETSFNTINKNLFLFSLLLSLFIRLLFSTSLTQHKFQILFDVYWFSINRYWEKVTNSNKMKSLFQICWLKILSLLFTYINFIGRYSNE